MVEPKNDEVRKRGRPMKYYTVYNRATDKIAAFGTADECVKQLGYTGKNTFQSVVSKSKKGILKKYEFIVDDSPYDDDGEIDFEYNAEDC